MKKTRATIWVVLVFLVITGSARAEFTLYGNEQRTVSSYEVGCVTLRDTSQVFIVSGAYISGLLPYDNSTANISGGYIDSIQAYSTVNISGGWVHSLTATGYTNSNISGGTIEYISSEQYSTTNITGGTTITVVSRDEHSTSNISGGTISDLIARAGITNIFSGTIRNLVAENSGTANISGGFITGNLYTDNFSTVNISGGTINGYLYARDSGVANILGQNFHYGSGLTLDGNRVVGTGVLSGEWLNGTSWAINISVNDSTATILAIPEPATLLLLGLGGLVLRRKR